MHTSNTHVNTLNQSATRFLQTQNVSRTISSVELRDMVNAARAQAGEPKVRNDQFIVRVEDELSGDLGECKIIAHPQSRVEMSS